MNSHLPLKSNSLPAVLIRFHAFILEIDGDSFMLLPKLQVLPQDGTGMHRLFSCRAKLNTKSTHEMYANSNDFGKSCFKITIHGDEMRMIELMLNGRTTQDFMESIYHDREPLSGIELANDTIATIYAGYLSAERGGVEVEIPI